MIAKGNLILMFLFLLGSNSIFSQQNDVPYKVEKENKIQERAKKRLIKPSTHILTIAVSNNRFPVILNSPSILLPSEMVSRIYEPSTGLVNSAFFNYEYSLPKNFFVEASFQYLRRWTYFKTNESIVRHHYYMSGFSTFSTSFGSGYRFVGANNLRFFDVHFGFTVGITDNPLGYGQALTNTFEYIDNNGNQAQLYYSWEYRIKSRFSLGFYLGISKDIRITKNLYATFKYHYQFGKWSKITDHTIGYSISNLNINETVKASITEKGQMFALGLRWFFVK